MNKITNKEKYPQVLYREILPVGTMIRTTEGGSCERITLEKFNGDYGIYYAPSGVYVIVLNVQNDFEEIGVSSSEEELAYWLE